MDWLTDKKFLVGVAVGFLIVPRVLKTVQGMATKAKAGG